VNVLCVAVGVGVGVGGCDQTLAVVRVNVICVAVGWVGVVPL